MRKTITIIGGSQQSTFERIGLKSGLNVLFHNGKNKKCFNPLIKKSDIVVILKGACSHGSMWKAKDMAGKLNKPICFHDGRGASGSIEKAAGMVG